MSNRILHVELSNHSVVPAEAEVHAAVTPQRLDGAQARGRLMGPRCLFASTVEVAYPFRPVLVPTPRPALTLRAIIPEASLWEPQTPHLYVGVIELWQDGVRCDVVEVRHGLRQVSVGARGLRLNGHLIRLRGREVSALDEDGALQLRQAGYNLLVCPVGDAAASVWEVADRVGFLVLGRLAGGEPAGLCRRLAGHASCLGWLLAPGVPPPDEVPPGTLLGAEKAAGQAGAPPALACFHAVRAGGDRQVAGRPLLLLGADAGQSAALLNDPGVVGVVEG